MAYFANTTEFLAQFGDYATKNFFDPIHLNDTKVGFSIKRNYPSDIRYKPAIGQRSGDPDNIAALWVVYTHPDESRREVDPSAVPIRIRIGTMSLYRTKHWDYDYEDKDNDCPSRESVEVSLSTPKPIELEYPGEYFFNHTLSQFVDRNGKSIAGSDILDRVFRDHCNTVHLVWGLRLRAKLFAQDKSAGFLSGLLSLLTGALKHLFGRTLQSTDTMAGLYRPYKSEALKQYGSDSFDVFGYKASKRVVVLFCALAIVGSIYNYRSGVTNGYWSSIWSNEFLLFVHGVFVVWLLDVAVPWCLFWMINGTILLRTRIQLMKLKGP